jgi:DNA-binding beta-propeller fold protein YncE
MSARILRPWARLGIVGAIAALASCRPAAQTAADATNELNQRPRLPTGAYLDPVTSATPVGSMPLAMVLAPGGGQAVVLLNGWREQGIQVVDRATRQVSQTLLQPAAFLGIAFSPDGRSLYTSGGNQDVVYRYAWARGQATLADSIALAVKEPNRSGRSYPAGIALSRDGTTLYVAENLYDSLAVVDIPSKRVVQRFATERYPYGVAVAPDGRVFVSAWGGNTISMFRPRGDGTLQEDGRLRVARHPSALALSADGARLFVASGSTDRVAVVDTRARRVVAELHDPPPAGPREGSTPNALALDAGGTRLFVAEADNNAIAIFDLSAATSGVASATGNDSLAGRVPVEWYPTAVIASGDTLLVANGKGRTTAPNRDYPHPGTGVHTTWPLTYTLGQLNGSVLAAPLARVRGAALGSLTQRVERANGWRDVKRDATYPPFEHVVYIIKENRTYDQVFGDMPRGDGDTSLVFFPRANSPNHHAMADRFGLFDRFFVNAEVSPDGHNWSMAAYATDYLEKTVPSNYSNRGRTYDWEGTNRNAVPSEEGAEDASEPASGYLWDLVQRKGLTFRNYGEFVIPERANPNAAMPAGYRGVKPFLAANTNRDFPPFDMNITDQRRTDIWMAEFQDYVRRGTLPAFMIVRLPNDHTAGARAGAPTPQAYMADNDLALGRIVEAISKSPFWRSTLIVVLEDDAQNGPDHVDSHRSVLLVISAYSRGGTVHRFTNTTDVLATMEEVLGLDALSQFDHYGRPLREIWTTEPDLRPYTAIVPSVSLNDRNPSSGRDARESAKLDFEFEDVADEESFNRILWRTIKGASVPYPGTTRMSALEWKRGW